MNWFNGEPATAKVTHEQPSRLSSVDASNLQALRARFRDLRLHIKGSMKLETRDKLLTANRRFPRETNAYE